MTAKKRKDNLPVQLTPQKIKAIDLLVSGQSVVDTAEELGIAYETLSRWRNHDSVFIAAFNARRLYLWEANAERLRSLVNKAVRVIEAAFDSKNESTRLKAADMILRSVGLANLPSPSNRIKPDQIEVDLQNEAFHDSMKGIAAILREQEESPLSINLG